MTQQENSPFEDGEGLAGMLADVMEDVGPLVVHVEDSGRAAFTWRTIDEDLLLAELSFDSSLDAAVATTRAGEGAGRVLVFSVSLQSVEVEVLSDRVVGQFVPPERGEVVVETENGRHEPVEVDPVGFFELNPVPRGMVRFHCHTPTTRLVSSWVRL